MGAAPDLLQPAAEQQRQVASHEGAQDDRRGQPLARHPAPAQRRVQLGLHVHLGHGLTYDNVKHVVRIPGVEELNIGHSIVARAVLVGMERAVREMKEAICHAERARA